MSDLEKLKVKRKFKEDIEPEEILMDSKRLKESPDSEKEKLEKPIKENILRGFFIAIIIVLALLLIKGLELQIIRGSYWREMAEENRIRSIPIEPLRGIIYDKNKIPLAINVSKLDLVIIPADLAKRKEFELIIKRLALALEKPKEQIESKIKENINLSYPIIIQEDIPTEKALLLKSRFSDIQEISVRKDSRRQYEDSHAFAHIIGYLGRANKEEVSQKKYFLDDYIGREGIESTYENILRGSYGEELVEIDSLGKFQKVLAVKEPTAGKDIVLSVDAGLQKKTYEVLRAKLNTLSTSKAAAIAVNPQNGKILALVSFPSFDNNEFVRGLTPELFNKIIQDKNQPLLNRAIMGLYPPGSTIKPLIASAALQEGTISPNRQINCHGYISVIDKYNPNVVWTYNDWKAHGPTDMIKAIAESCDVYFYTVGGGYGEVEGLGIENIEKYLKLFDWNQILGIDLPGEKSGFIPNPLWKKEVRNEDWYTGDTYNCSIGQGDITVTPLELTMAMAAIANGGKIFQPQLLNEKKPEIINQGFIKPEFLEVARKGMREAVLSGSARSLADLAVEVAGKTGTAQVSKVKNPHAWFTVFAPYDNPQIVLTILVENGGEGSTTAVPIAKEILNWYFSK